jgi:hypothetical protein
MAWFRELPAACFNLPPRRPSALASTTYIVKQSQPRWTEQPQTTPLRSIAVEKLPKWPQSLDHRPLHKCLDLQHVSLLSFDPHQDCSPDQQHYHFKHREWLRSTWHQEKLFYLHYHVRLHEYILRKELRDIVLIIILETVEGTVNDPAVVPHTSPSHGSYHWDFERYYDTNKAITIAITDGVLQTSRSRLGPTHSSTIHRWIIEPHHGLDTLRNSFASFTYWIWVRQRPMTNEEIDCTNNYISACITDYFPAYRVPGVKRALEWVLRFATVLAGLGLYSFETNDIGLTAAIAKIWQS